MAQLTYEEKSKLLKLAAEATSGPWAVYGPYPSITIGEKYIEEGDMPFLQLWDYKQGEAPQQVKRDAEYIVSASPDVVLSLLDEIDDLEYEIKRRGFAIALAQERIAQLETKIYGNPLFEE